MKTMSVAEFKSRFSSVLNDVRRGDSVVIEYGRSHRPVAVLHPYDAVGDGAKRRLGVREGEASYSVSMDWELTDEELGLS